MGPSKEGGLWPEETNSDTTFPRKMQVCQPLPQKPYCYHASLMLRKKGILQRIYPDESRRRRGYGNHQDSWSPCGYRS